MKYVWMTLLLIVGLIPFFRDQDYYADFWAGTHPNGFAVIQNGVVLPGRTVMNSRERPDLKCEVPMRAVYSPLNSSRPAQYVTLTRPIPMFANTDLVMGFQNDVKVRKGDRIEYLLDQGEGAFLVRYKGKVISSDLALLDKVAYDEKALKTRLYEEWLKISCLNGGDAWILMQDLANYKGLDSWQRGWKEFGVVTDIDAR